jgi:hypothetical protein
MDSTGKKQDIAFRRIRSGNCAAAVAISPRPMPAPPMQLIEQNLVVERGNNIAAP